jgi:uncharacterized repeat protein (TIGR03803 family)
MTKVRISGLFNLLPTRIRNAGRVGKLGLAKTACIVFAACIAAAIASPAQTFTTLVSFDGTNGATANPGLVLAQSVNGNFYGATDFGGTSSNCSAFGNGCGTIFEVTPSGTLTSLDSFTSLTYASSLIQATDGNLYGTTEFGGSFGTVFKITPSGTLTTLYTFTGGTDGGNPVAGLVQGTDGNFYGTALGGGASANCSGGCGTVFRITSGGTLTTLHSFDMTDGFRPYGALIQATNGDFYGTTYFGGASTNCSNGCGTVFRITPGGTFTTLHSFALTDGAHPFVGGDLLQAANGNLYGTTNDGGATSSDCSSGCGTVFKITLAGTLTTLHSFAFTDGGFPGGLVQATDGNLYGTTQAGSGLGTIFKITPGGTLTTLHSFDLTDGDCPSAGLVQATDGNFYGTTYGNCSTNSSNGTVYSLSVSLGPFVKTLPTSGKEGSAVIILGTNLTGATAVSFNGTAATFTVVSGSEITTTVPAGAKTGTVEVTTPSGRLKSNLTFRVTPQILSFTPTSGVVGTSVTITGTELTQATQVTFGGVKATTFSVESDSEVMATVPTGAKTGKIAITTPGGTATSAATFTVTP